MSDAPSDSGDRVLAAYRGRGLAGRVGFGHKPAVIAVDLILGFTDPDLPLGSDLDAVVDATLRLIHAARARDVPVLFTTTAYDEGMRDAGIFPLKVPALSTLVRGTKAVDLDPRLGRQPDETLIEKRYASAFFGTALASELNSSGVDTLVVCGATTSGCIRATVVDALQHGFRPIVPVECVGDRSESAHHANLTDIEGKYGDVVGLDEVIEYLESLSVDAR